MVTTDDLSGYGRATDAGAPDPLDVLRAAVDAIEIVIAADATESSLVDVLHERAAGGCRVRMVVEDPDDRLEELRGVDGIEICASPGGGGTSSTARTISSSSYSSRSAHRAKRRPSSTSRGSPMEDCSTASPTTSRTAGTTPPRSTIESSCVPPPRQPSPNIGRRPTGSPAPVRRSLTPNPARRHRARSTRTRRADGRGDPADRQRDRHAEANQGGAPRHDSA